MNTSETGRKPGEEIPGFPPGISKRTSPEYHNAPFRLRLYHRGKETQSYHATLEDAIKAKGKADRLKAKEGSHALGYDRKAQMEYEEARRILGPGINLVDMARKIAARESAGHVSRTVKQAADEFLTGKESLNRSRKHVQDIRQRLTRFADAFPDRDLETITGGEILDFLNGLGLAPRSLWNFYGTTASLFHHATRREWIDKNPILKIDPDADLPAKPKAPVQILTIGQGAAIMRQIETCEPLYIAWACLQYFLGVRDAEAERFRGEWIDRKKRRIVIPGWHFDGETAEAVAKTRDEWIIDSASPAFWQWVDRYPEAFSEGPTPYPNAPAWERARDAVIAQGHFKAWPQNGFRHSFATYHLSWLRDAQKTSFILRHRSPQKLWDSYFAKFATKAEGKRYLSLEPLPRLSSGSRIVSSLSPHAIDVHLAIGSDATDHRVGE